MKRVLIITYYWPPAGGSGVQRWLKFVKYLPGTGWEPVVYTVENGDYPIVDKTLEAEVPPEIEVIRRPIREPNRWYRKINPKGGEVNVGFAGSDRQSLAAKVSIWIRSNLFIPDARMLWIKPSINFLQKVLTERHFDVIVTTGPPHSMHMIGLGLHKKSGVKWVADFRDPWTNIDYIDKLKLTQIAKRKHQQLEREVLVTADSITTVSNGMKEELAGLGAKQIRVITNGFDEQDFEDKAGQEGEVFSITHVGVVPPSRNPEVLWKALGELLTENEELSKYLKIRFVGKVDNSVISRMESAGIGDYVELIGQVDHSEAIHYMQSSSILLLIINDAINANTILPGKMFEYLGAERPVLAVGPCDGQVREVLEETSAGEVRSHDDLEGMKELVNRWYHDFRQGKLAVDPKQTNKYSRRTLTGKLAEHLNEISQ